MGSNEGDVWYDGIPVTATIDVGGQQVPLRDQAFIKESADLEAFARRALDQHSEVGRRIPLKVVGDAELAKWKTDNLPKLYEAGILSKPPDTAADYGVVKPDVLPDGLAWSDEMASEFGTLLHKHGASKALADGLLDLYGKALFGTQKTLETNYDTALAALKTEHAEHFEERKELAKRLTKQIFKSDEELAFFEELGLGDHPGFLSVMMRLAPLAASDSSYLKDAIIAPAATGEDVRSELGRIMSDKTHPMHAGYHQRDPAVLKHIEEIYKKAYPGTTEI